MHTRSRMTRLGILAATPLLLVSISACGADTISNKAFMAKMQDGMKAMDTAHTTMTMKAQLFDMEAEGDIDYTQDPAAMEMEVTSGENVSTVRVIDSIMYVSTPDVPDGKFYRLDPKDPGNPLAGQGDFSKQMDPIQAIERISKGLEKVELKGTEKVDGVEADHYALTLDPAKIQGMPTTADAQLPDKLIYDVWLDSEDRTVKLKINLGPKLGLTEMTCGDFGAPVNIKAPSADQIVALQGQ